MKIKFSSRSIPFALITVCILAFGLLIPYLGFYQDDWHPVYYGFSRGLASLWELFLSDGRPFASYLYHIGFQLLGFSPLRWHLVALGLRTLTVLITWFYLRDIWPGYTRQVTWAVLIFAIYPLFDLQPLALIYAIHWTGFLLFTVSIWAMVRSIRHPSQFWLYLFISLATSTVHLALIEYFSGVELIRPVILWLLMADRDQLISRRMWKVMKNWLPYLIVFFLYTIYRVYLLPLMVDAPNTPTLLFDLIHKPIATLFELFQTVLQDMVIILVSSWNNVVNPAAFEITRSATIKAIAIAIAAGLALYFYLSHLNTGDDEQYSYRRLWFRSAIVFGLIITLLGPVPGWVTKQGLTQSNLLWSSRFGLASMVGASIVIVCLLELLITNLRYRSIALCLLVALSVGWHVRNTNDFRWAWVKQSRFYQQLFWRAPFIEPGTAIFSEGEIFPFMGEYPTSFALGTLYPKTDNSHHINYWFFGLYNHFADRLDSLSQGLHIEDSAYTSQFQGNSLDSLVIHYEPEKNQCLWVLRPEDAEIRVLPGITREAAAVSNLSRIHPIALRPLPAEIFGKEDISNWCYYYQKADLARQFEEWEKVVSLWREADQNGYSPGNGVEYLPFIEGFAHTGDWQTAEQMTLRANLITHVMSPILCSTWERIEDETMASEARDEILITLRKRLACP